MDVRLLGQVGLWHNGQELPLARSHRRCVLAVLAINPGRPVPSDVLIDRIWGEQPPRDVVHSLRTHVSAIRRLIAAATGDQAAVRCRDGCYLLEIEPDLIDLHRARRYARDATKCSTDPAGDRQALAMLRKAHALWRGVPLAGVGGGWADQIRVGLDQERLSLAGSRFDRELRVGEHASVLGELAALRGEYPLAEPLVGLQMLALYRCGQQAAALELFARTRQRLVEEIGDEPGAELGRLHGQILRRDPALDLAVEASDQPVAAAAPEASVVRPSGETAASAASAVVPRQLPRDAAGFTGRAAQLDQLDLLLPEADREPARQPAVCLINGPAGVGKTALAVHWAHRVADQFPDGQLFVDLHGFTDARATVDASDALDRMLRTWGVPGERIPADLDDRAGLWRSLLLGRRLLLLLDNAASEAQVQPLLPGEGGCVVLVTSRRRLAGLDHTHALPLDTLAPAEAVTLLRRTAGERRLGQERPELLAETVELCGRLPLAIRLAAARLSAHSTWSLADVVERLRDRQRRLPEFNAGQRSVAGALDLSYQQLGADQQGAYRLLGLHPGEHLEPYAVAALAGTDLAQARQLLDQLHDVHLLQEPSSGRYAFHDLTWAHAVATGICDETGPERRAAQARLLDHYRHAAAVAMDVLHPYERERRPAVPPADGPIPDLTDPDRALGWLETELPNLLAAARQAADDGWGQHLLHLSVILHRHLRANGYYRDAEMLHRWALTAADTTGDRAGGLATLIGLGNIHRLLGRDEPAGQLFDRALAAARATGDQVSELEALIGYGFIRKRQGDHKQAAHDFDRALAAAHATGHRIGAVEARNGLGHIHLIQSRHDDAAEHLGWALENARAIGYRGGEVHVLTGLAWINSLQERHDLAIGYLERALETARATGHRASELNPLNGLGQAYRLHGRYPQAVGHHQQALELARHTGHRASELAALFGLGAVHLLQGQGRQAMDHFQQLLDLARQTGSRNWQFEAQHGLGRVHYAAGHPDQALAQHERALTLAIDLEQPVDQARAHDGLAHAYRALDQPGPARQHWQQALDLLIALGTDYTEEAQVSVPAINTHLAGTTSGRS